MPTSFRPRMFLPPLPPSPFELVCRRLEPVSNLAQLIVFFAFLIWSGFNISQALRSAALSNVHLSCLRGGTLPYGVPRNAGTCVFDCSDKKPVDLPLPESGPWGLSQDHCFALKTYLSTLCCLFSEGCCPFTLSRPPGGTSKLHRIVVALGRELKCTCPSLRQNVCLARLYGHHTPPRNEWACFLSIDKRVRQMLALPAQYRTCSTKFRDTRFGHCVKQIAWQLA